MLRWIKSEEDAIRLIWAEIIVLLVFVFSPLVVQAIPYAASAVGYECGGGECKPVHPEERIAIFTIWLVGFTAVLSVATILLWDATRAAVKDAKESATRQSQEFQQSLLQGRELFIAERRPWLKLTANFVKAESEFYGPKMGGSVTVDLAIENVGLSPAFDVFMHLMQPSLRYYRTDRDVTKVEMERARSAPAGGGYAMFPGEKRETSPTWTYELENRTGDAHFVYFVGWLGYRFGVNEALHYTPFVYEIRWRTAADEERKVRSEFFMRLRHEVNLPPD